MKGISNTWAHQEEVLSGESVASATEELKDIFPAIRKLSTEQNWKYANVQDSYTYS